MQNPTAITPNELIVVKECRASKLSGRAQGLLTYRVGYAPDKSEIYIAITGNDGGGYFSKEWIPFSRIAAKLDELKSGKPFSAVEIKAVFCGKSSNNASFLASVLVAEGLLSKAPNQEARLVVAGDATSWNTAMLVLDGSLVSLVKEEGAVREVVPNKSKRKDKQREADGHDSHQAT